MSEPITIAPTGRLDSSNSAILQKEIMDKIGQLPGPLHIDLSGLDYISSAGLRVLLIAAKSTQSRGGKTILLSPKPLVGEVLKISGFDRIIEIRW